MIQGLIQLWTVGAANPSEAGSFVLSDNFFNMAKYKEAMEQILAGLISQVT